MSNGQCSHVHKMPMDMTSRHITEKKMSLFFTADQHFGHANILQYEAHSRVTPYGQTFASVEAMNEALIEHWNAVVQPDDTVYCLGALKKQRPSAI